MDTENHDVIMRVGAASSTQETGSAISHAIYDGKTVVLRAVGAGAVNQAVKSLIIAQTFVAQRGQMLAIRPGFTTIQMDDGERTAIIFRVFTIK